MSAGLVDTTPAERMAVTFARVLRGSSLRVPIGNVLMFVEALGRVGISERTNVYWAARSTLVHQPEDLALFDRAFAVFWDHAQGNAIDEDPEIIKITLATDDENEGDDDGESATDSNDDLTLTLRFSSVEVLRNKDFGAYDEDRAPTRPAADESLAFRRSAAPVVPISVGSAWEPPRSAGDAAQRDRGRG